MSSQAILRAWHRHQWLYANVHPTLRGAEQITLDLRVGFYPRPLRSAYRSSERGVFGTMQQKDPIFGAIHDDRAALAAALGLSIDDLDPSLPAQTVSTGMAFCIVPLRGLLEVAARLRLPAQASQDYLSRSDAKFFHCITPAAPGANADWHARMQFYNGEDPATGSASGCAIAWLVRHGLVASRQPTVIEQGVEMLRPSRLHVQATLSRYETVSEVCVGGRTIPVANGRFFL